MLTQSDAEKDSATVLTPAPAPRSPWRVKRVEALADFCLRVHFMDGLEGTVDMSPLIHSKDAGVFAALTDPLLFDKVYIEYGAVTWPGEIDLAPDAMYDAIKADGRWVLR